MLVGTSGSSGSLSRLGERVGVRAGFIPLSRLRERAGVRVAVGARHIGLQPIEDAQPHRLTLHQHLAVGEAQHVIPELVQFGRAPGVGSHALIAEMLTAVEFDDQHRLDTREVGEVTADWMLSPELLAEDLPIAQGLPHCTLGVGRGLAQLARPVGGAGHRINPHPNPLPRGEGIKRAAVMAVIQHGSLSRWRERTGVRVAKNTQRLNCEPACRWTACP